MAGLSRASLAGSGPRRPAAAARHGRRGHGRGDRRRDRHLDPEAVGPRGDLSAGPGWAIRPIAVSFLAPCLPFTGPSCLAPLSKGGISWLGCWVLAVRPPPSR